MPPAAASEQSNPTPLGDLFADLETMKELADKSFGPLPEDEDSRRGRPFWKSAAPIRSTWRATMTSSTTRTPATRTVTSGSSSRSDSSGRNLSPPPTLTSRHESRSERKAREEREERYRIEVMERRAERARREERDRPEAEDAKIAMRLQQEAEDARLAERLQQEAHDQLVERKLQQRAAKQVAEERRQRDQKMADSKGRPSHEMASTRLDPTPNADPGSTPGTSALEALVLETPFLQVSGSQARKPTTATQGPSPNMARGTVWSPPRPAAPGPRSTPTTKEVMVDNAYSTRTDLPAYREIPIGRYWSRDSQRWETSTTSDPIIPLTIRGTTDPDNLIGYCLTYPPNRRKGHFRSVSDNPDAELRTRIRAWLIAHLTLSTPDTTVGSTVVPFRVDYRNPLSRLHWAAPYDQRLHGCQIPLQFYLLRYAEFTGKEKFKEARPQICRALDMAELDRIQQWLNNSVVRARRHAWFQTTAALGAMLEAYIEMARLNNDLLDAILNTGRTYVHANLPHVFWGVGLQFRPDPDAPTPLIIRD